MTMRTGPGRPYPFGASVTAEGINFAVFSRHATHVFLELFAPDDTERRTATLELDPERNRTGDMWHIFVGGLGHGQPYGVRVDGPYTPEEDGSRFNVNKLLSDPYATALSGSFNLDHDAVYGYDRAAAAGDLSFSEADSAPYTVRSIALASSSFDWEEDRPPHTALNDSVIAEVHVKGLTAHPSSAVAHPGTYLGVAEKIPHFLKLGVTAVELLPIHEFNEGEPIGTDPINGTGLHNFWGYSTLGFFAPEISYAADQRPGGPAAEFKQMVKALHRAGLEVILDVVFNHTGEGDERGPTLTFRGLDNAVYYMLDNHRRYKNYSGCGNTVACNHPVVKQFILDCLRYWAVEMRVDGFRFDLATILGRGRQGQWIGDLSLLYDIGGDPVLRGCKLIAESWDAEGMYKVGGFPEGWAEWNGRFRDDVRRFVRGDNGVVPQLARRLGGSLDLFALKRNPANSINFITAHDGFTLRDLVSYGSKHNERNAEENRDGTSENLSSNHGVEGETDDEAIRELRRRQAKNLMTILLIARGTPMMLGGDELWRTKQGNNNTYCQDNELGWLDWGGGAETQEVHRFFRLLVALRRNHPALRRPCFVDPFAVDGGAGPTGTVGTDITWHGVRPGRPDWSYHSHTLALQIHGDAPISAPGTEDNDFFVVLNAWTEDLEFELPGLPAGQAWRRLIDTALPGPQEIVEEDAAVEVSTERLPVKGRSVVVLIG
jgi:isoamylase